MSKQTEALAEQPYEIGARLAREGKGLSDIWGVVESDADMTEAQRGYEAALAERSAQEPCAKCKGLGYYDEGHECDDGSMAGGNYVECDKCKQPEFIKHEVENAYDWSEWVCPNPEGYLMKCCDCGLVHEAQFRVAKYKPAPSDEFEVVSDPDLQAQFRMRRSEQWSPKDMAYRPGGLPLAGQPAQQEPVAEVLNERGEVDWISFVPIAGTLLFTSPPAQQQEPVAKMGMYEHKCPNVTGHRGPSFVCQKAGHGVGQNSYCKGCTCPEALNTSPQPVGHLRMGPRQDFVTTGAAGDLEINVWHPVYTSPPASKPLTDEQAVKVVKFAIHNLSLTCEGPLNVDDIGMWVVRATEAAHGIKGDA